MCSFVFCLFILNKAFFDFSVFFLTLSWPPVRHPHAIVYVIVGLHTPFRDIIIYYLLPHFPCSLIPPTPNPPEPRGLWLENKAAVVAQKAERIYRKTGLNEFMHSQSGQERRRKEGRIKLTWFQPSSPLCDSNTSILPLGWPPLPDSRFSKTGARFSFFSDNLYFPFPHNRTEASPVLKWKPEQGKLKKTGRPAHPVCNVCVLRVCVDLDTQFSFLQSPFYITLAKNSINLWLEEKATIRWDIYLRCLGLNKLQLFEKDKNKLMLLFSLDGGHAVSPSSAMSLSVCPATKSFPVPIKSKHRPSHVYIFFMHNKVILDFYSQLSFLLHCWSYNKSFKKRQKMKFGRKLTC